ncbi:MAG: hypothetical protein NTW56_04635 [Alphaproteobacteria bacterium]|nr:hypothetical protein [Alphaproteobacteria bacterium]
MLHPDVAAFAALLRRLEQHLAAHGATYWATSISRSRAAVEASDAGGLTRFLGMLGGSGSLNDLMLEGGNAELGRMCSAAWKLATKLQHEEDEARRG